MAPGPGGIRHAVHDVRHGRLIGADLVGGCRMGTSPRQAVVDAELRSFAVPNLLVTDGSVLPTQGSANPALTIMALADRAAARLTAGARGGLRAPVRRGAR